MQLTNRFDQPIQIDSEKRLYSELSGEGAVFAIEMVSDGYKEAVCLAQKADTVILALGCHPMVCAKEEIDCTTLAEKSAKQVQMQSAFCFPIIRIQSTRSRIVCQRFCGMQLEVRIWERQWQRHCMVKMRRQED